MNKIWYHKLHILSLLFISLYIEFPAMAPSNQTLLAEIQVKTLCFYNIDIY